MTYILLLMLNSLSTGADDADMQKNFGASLAKDGYCSCYHTTCN